MVPSKREGMTTIWVERELAEELKSHGKMGDTYSTVIRRLLSGSNPAGKGEPHEDRGGKGNEPTGIGD